MGGSNFDVSDLQLNRTAVPGEASEASDPPALKPHRRASSCIVLGHIYAAAAAAGTAD